MFGTCQPLLVHALEVCRRHSPVLLFLFSPPPCSPPLCWGVLYHSCAKQPLPEAPDSAQRIPGVLPSLEENQQLEKWVFSLIRNESSRCCFLFISVQNCALRGPGSNNPTEEITGAPFPQCRRDSTPVLGCWDVLVARFKFWIFQERAWTTWWPLSLPFLALVGVT